MRRVENRTGLAPVELVVVIPALANIIQGRCSIRTRLTALISVASLLMGDSAYAQSNILEISHVATEHSEQIENEVSVDLPVAPNRK